MGRVALPVRSRSRPVPLPAAVPPRPPPLPPQPHCRDNPHKAAAAAAGISLRPLGATRNNSHGPKRGPRGRRPPRGTAAPGRRWEAASGGWESRTTPAPRPTCHRSARPGLPVRIRSAAPTSAGGCGSPSWAPWGRSRRPLCQARPPPGTRRPALPGTASRSPRAGRAGAGRAPGAGPPNLRHARQRRPALRRPRAPPGWGRRERPGPAEQRRQRPGHPGGCCSRQRHPSS